MEDKKKRTSNRGLVMMLCVLIVLIVGLGIGIMLATNNNNKYEDQQSMGGDDLDEGEGVEEIIAEYQAKIDAADSDEEKVELYEGMLKELKLIMEQTGSDYCVQITDSVVGLFGLTSDEDINRVFNEIPEKCIYGGEAELLTTEVGGVDE